MSTTHRLNQSGEGQHLTREANSFAELPMLLKDEAACVDVIHPCSAVFYDTGPFMPDYPAEF